MFWLIHSCAHWEAGEDDAVGQTFLRRGHAQDRRPRPDGKACRGSAAERRIWLAALVGLAVRDPRHRTHDRTGPSLVERPRNARGRRVSRSEGRRGGKEWG